MERPDQSRAAGSVASRLRPFGTSIFAEMTRLANEAGAINLSQGFPDFDGPEIVRRAAREAIDAGHNQYAPMAGLPALTGALARQWRARTNQDIDPGSSITITAGCTEALAATFLGLIEAGDEVILFEPYYDSYRACVAMAGGTPRFVTLREPAAGADGSFWFDEQELAGAFCERTRAILINTPHNPTGKVFSRAELEFIAGLCVRHGVIAICDEVYEHLTYDPEQAHVHLATIAGMRERTITLSSLGKTFSVTGWKIGWAIGPPALSAGVRAAHQFLTYAPATPFQHAASVAIERGDELIQPLRERYQRARDMLASALREIGMRVFTPAGTYFLLADHSAFGFADDVAFCRHMTSEVGVAAIPPSAFYEHKELARALVRFAFCKRMETLERAIERLGRLRR